MSEHRHQTTDKNELLVVTECRTLYFLIYHLVKDRKDYYLWQHCLRSLVSVGSNLSEGNNRDTKEQLRYIDIAKGSMTEFEFQYSLINISDSMIDDKIDHIKAMIHKLRSSVLGKRRSDSP